ncbi:hypothetical protein LCGC14_0521450 [marine sediment metagenome]|uniref:Nucleotide modification associated domain-containing protein n=1 Tax=marine sediment metagenome TaxID=412755 RepID=A0A0F9RYF9_9ZZZZ
MLLFCHIEVRDAGFAPNPFWKYLTLANCKPAIRRKANIGDWVIGLSPSKEENKIIYCMKVKEVMTFEDYYNDERFKIKRPIMNAKKDIYRKGDNIYPKINEGHIQLFSRHSHKDGSTNMKNKIRDLSGINVLISINFYYFGMNMIVNPFKFLRVGRGFTSKFNEDQIEELLSYLKNFKKGISGCPSNKWKKGDESWRIGL